MGNKSMNAQRIHETGGQPSHCFWCPGCDMAHCINDTVWTFNGDDDHPTIQPSIHVQGGSTSINCHSFVTDGRIQFLGDSSHHLAGQTVELPAWPIGSD